MFIQNFDSFPIHSLPLITQGAVIDAYTVTGVPAVLAAGAVLSAAAVACQGHLKVRSPIGSVCPLSLYFLHIAKSGERKTTVEELCLTGLRDFQNFHRSAAVKANVDFDVKHKIWEKKLRLIEKKLLTVQDDSEVSDIGDLLKSHLLARPQKCQGPTLFYSDTTIEALLHKLATEWPSAFLRSSEASLIMTGRAVKNLAFLNELWGAGTLEVNRRTGESFTVDDARCSLSLWCQPGAAQAFVAKGKGHARDVGFLARCLPSAPTSTQGYRQTTTHRMETKNLDNFTAITRQLLGKYLSDDGVLCTETTVLEVQADAAEEWRYFCNRVETQLVSGGYLSDIPDFASKIAENVVRIAGVFHAIEGKPGTLIDRETILSAIAVGHWYLDEFKRLFGAPQQLSEEFEGGRLLEIWLRERSAQYPGHYAIRVSHIRTFGPNRLRNKKALDQALDQLCREDKLWIGIQNMQRFAVLTMTFFALPGTMQTQQFLPAPIQQFLPAQTF